MALLSCECRHSSAPSELQSIRKHVLHAQRQSFSKRRRVFKEAEEEVDEEDASNETYVGHLQRLPLPYVSTFPLGGCPLSFTGPISRVGGVGERVSL